MAKTKEINLEEDGIYIIQNGVPTQLTPLQYGHDTITWQNSKIIDAVRSDRVRLDGQEVI